MISAVSGIVYPAYFSNSPGSNSINYNIYYNTANSNIIFRNSNSYTISNFLNPVGGGDSSFNVLPSIISKYDLHLANICTNKGVNLNTFVSNDIDNQVRPVSPDIGCDEAKADSNDISVTQLIQPVFPISPGLQNLSVKISNNGTNTIISFNISYILNSGLAVTQPWSGTLNPCDTSLVLFTGLQQINLINGVNTLKVFTSSPNGSFDRNTLNDTLVSTLATPMIGTYLIGSAPSDFTTINSACNALATRGVSGRVICNIKTGTYLESIALTAISGSSVTNTILFKSLANQADSVLINSNTNGFFALKLTNTSFVKFRSVSISLNGTLSNSAIITLDGTSSYDTIENCKLTRPSIAIPGLVFSVLVNQAAVQNFVLRKTPYSEVLWLYMEYHQQAIQIILPLNPIKSKMLIALLISNIKTDSYSEII